MNVQRVYLINKIFEIKLDNLELIEEETKSVFSKKTISKETVSEIKSKILEIKNIFNNGRPTYIIHFKKKTMYMVVTDFVDYVHVKMLSLKTKDFEKAFDTTSVSLTGQNVAFLESI